MTSEQTGADSQRVAGAIKLNRSRSRDLATLITAFMLGILIASPALAQSERVTAQSAIETAQSAIKIVQSDTTTAHSDPSLAQLSALFGRFSSFQASVRQLIMESSGSVLEESSIVFKMQRPDGFYWETIEPFPELIVTDGQTLWNYQPDLYQLTIEDWQSESTELAARLLAGRIQDLDEQYTVRATPVDAGGTEFLLTPKDNASLYSQVLIYFEDEELETILLINTNGQRTFWEFLDREINPVLHPSTFRFVAPEDEELDVIDNRAVAPASQTQTDGQ